MKRISFFVVSISLMLASITCADVSEKNAKLIQAVRNGNLMDVKAALADGADINAKDISNGATALIVASYEGHTEVVKLLIEKGADVNAKDNNGVTSLLNASYQGHTEVVKLLIEKGVDVKAKDNNGVSPLMNASMTGHTKIIKLLLDNGSVTDDNIQGLPNAMGTGKKAMICGTSESKAIYAGLDVLKQGGSAVDAALTTALAQIVLDGGAPISFAGIMDMVYYEASTGKVYSMGASYNTLQEEKDPLSIPKTSSSIDEIKSPTPIPKGRTVLVPGFMAGVEAAHKRFGKIHFESIFQPAIDLAETGVPWSSALDNWFNMRRNILSRLKETKAIFIKENGDFYKFGDLFKQPELAKTLKRVSKDGASYMYTGEWAKKFVKVVQSEGGKLTMKDLADYKVEWREPLVVNYHGYDINLFHEAFTTAVPLNLMEAADISGKGHYTESPESFYWFIRIIRGVLRGDFSNQLSQYKPEDLLDKKIIKQIWEQVRKSNSSAVATSVKDDSPKHSAGIVAVDKEGNVVALLHSINTNLWGENGIFIDGVSIPDSASFQQELIKYTGPGKRLYSGLPVLIAMKDGKPIMSLSSVASGLIQETLKVLINMIDFNMNPKEANDAASFLYSLDSPREQITAGVFSPDLLNQARKMGLQIDEVPIGQAMPRRGAVVNIRIDPKNGNVEGAVPLLYDGVALGY